MKTAAVKTTAVDLQMNSAAPGMRFDKLDKARVSGPGVGVEGPRRTRWNSSPAR